MRVVMVVTGVISRLVCMASILIDRCGGRYKYKYSYK